MDQTQEHIAPVYKILPPKMDIIFKLLFGDSRNADILIDFLKSVLNLPEDEYASIAIADPQLKREAVDDKLGIVDVRVTTKSGKIIHIEIQVLEQSELPERITYYNSKMLVTQLKSGQVYGELQKTISIVIANFAIVQDSERYHHIFQLNEKETGILFTDLIEIHTLELSKIPMAPDNTKKYEWLQFLSAEREEEFQMIAEKNPVIQKAYFELKRLSQDEENQYLYEARQKIVMDENSRLFSARREGLKEGREEGKKEGRAEGKKEGREEGREEGKKEGREEGRYQQAKQTAKQMLGIGMDIDAIALCTGLSNDEIIGIKNDL